MVLDRKLGKAINGLENYLLTYPRQSDMEQLTSLRDDYCLMADYWQRGFDDPQRDEVFDRLLRRMYVLTSNIGTHWQLSNSAFLKAMHQRPRKIRQDWSMASVRASMETFVSDVAMLQLEPEEARQQKGEEVYRRHWETMRDLFDYILTSHQWRDGLADTFLELLLSPTLYTTDQQLIVSAITLSAMQTFCFQKFRVLAKVYMQATDEPLRQAALVGWVLAMDARPARLYTEMKDMVEQMCEDERTRHELMELQMQLIYCLEADADTATIQKEILPDIMSGSNIKVTKQGLVEMDEDTLDDILHPETSEQNIERMEQSMKRMVDMQQQGADIYFGGFAQMKRFPFFNETSNWLVPFYPQHPAISRIWRGTRGKKFLKAITKVGAFCDSDKYSFVLAFDQVLDRLPKGMLKLIEEGEATAMPIGGEVALEDQKQPAFIRRVYLQNLYRFFRLFSYRKEFFNPFEQENAKQRLIFFTSQLLKCDTLVQEHLAVASFLMKRHRYEDTAKVIETIPEERRDFQAYMVMGAALQHIGEKPGLSAGECYRKAVALRPDSDKALAGLARTLFVQQDYDEALEIYNKLMELRPDNRAHQLNAAVCLIHAGNAGDALKLLYKLNYEDGEDLAIQRVLAWALTVEGKYEQADKLYCNLLAQEKPQAGDMLNYGYCLWLSKNITAAIGMFRKFLENQGDDGLSLEKEFMYSEHQLLISKGITDAEIQLMLGGL